MYTSMERHLRVFQFTPFCLVSYFSRLCPHAVPNGCLKSVLAHPGDAFALVANVFGGGCNSRSVLNGCRIFVSETALDFIGVNNDLKYCWQLAAKPDYLYFQVTHITSGQVLALCLMKKACHVVA